MISATTIGARKNIASMQGAFFTLLAFCFLPFKILSYHFTIYLFPLAAIVSAFLTAADCAMLRIIFLVFEKKYSKVFNNSCFFRRFARRLYSVYPVRWLRGICE